MKLIKSIITISFLIVLFFSSCDYVKYTKAIEKETIQRFNSNKNFMKNISFTGYVLDKKKCEDCQGINKYSIILHLVKLSEKPKISNIQFNPYYSFENDSILTISVSKDLYDKLILNEKILKQANSFNIVRNNQEFQYLSYNKGKWLP